MTDEAVHLPLGPPETMASTASPGLASVTFDGTMAMMGVVGETTTVATPLQGLPSAFAA
jgi:hypothetical protein